METNRGREHLTAQEISAWLVEGPAPETEEHVQNCRLCQGKLAEAREPLAAFRTALVSWSEAQGHPRLGVDGLKDAGRRHWGFHIWLPAASLALATMLLAAFLTDSGALRRSGQQTTVAHDSTPPVSDAVLMDQVDAEVSETVPDSMAPLTDLVAWDAASGVSANDQGAVGKKPVSGTNAKVHAPAAD